MEGGDRPGTASGQSPDSVLSTLYMSIATFYFCHWINFHYSLGCCVEKLVLYSLPCVVSTELKLKDNSFYTLQLHIKITY